MLQGSYQVTATTTYTLSCILALDITNRFFVFLRYNDNISNYQLYKNFSRILLDYPLFELGEYCELIRNGNMIYNLQATTSSIVLSKTSVD